MIVLPIAVFVLIALAAITFAVGPLARAKEMKGRWILVAAIAVFLLGIGGGTYWMLGQPGLALRDTVPAAKRDVKGLIPLLVERVRQTPRDVTGWEYLGRAYMTARAPGEAARAFARAIELSRARGRRDPALYSAYGEALVMQAGGAVGPEAEAAFTAALAGDPSDAAGRFYLGLARAARGDRDGALMLWRSLAADVPANSAFHQMLVDRMAMLTAAGPLTGGAPDPRQMVANLAAKLKADPHNAPGWQRLIRAYHVLGQDADARTALATARKTFAADKAALAAFDQQAKELELK